MVGSSAYAQYVAKYDSAGTFAWLRQTPQTSSFSCAIAVDPRDGHVFLTGRCLNSVDGQPCGSADMFVMKFTPAGVKL